jgi:hypothetical protein
MYLVVRYREDIELRVFESRKSTRLSTADMWESMLEKEIMLVMPRHREKDYSALQVN